MRARPALTAAAAGLGLALAGCGSTTVRHVTTTVTRPASSSATSTSSSSSSTPSSSSTSTSSSSSASPSASAGGSGVAGRSPRAVLALAAAALRRSGGYAMNADLVQSGARTVIHLSANGTGRYSASLTTGATAFSVVALPGSAYLRGNRAFWTHQGGGARAGQLAGHWLRVPAAGRRSVTRSLGTLAPGTLARCLVEDHGTLSLAGRTTVNGHRALVVRDAGNAPGATPSTIDVAASGVPYPLRYVATGLARRGGRVDVCNNGKGGGATGTIALSQFGATPPVQAPETSGSAPGSGSAT